MRTVVISLHPAIDRIVRVKRLIPGDTFDGAVELLVPSGKGVNTARGVKALGGRAAEVLPLVWLGRAQEKWFTEELKRLSGLEAGVCPRACSTRQALTLLEADGRETHIKESMAPVTAVEERAFLAFYKKSLRRGDTVVLTGSPPPNVSDALLLQLIKLARKARVAGIFADTHGRPLEIAARAGLDGIKGNAAEIGAWLRLSKPFDPENAEHRRRLSKSFRESRAPRAIVITRGALGACYANADGLWMASAIKLKPSEFKSATGCGDAATAGWLHGVNRKFDPETKLRFAISCGSAKACSADPGHLDAELAQRFFKRSTAACFYPKKGLLSV